MMELVSPYKKRKIIHPVEFFTDVLDYNSETGVFKWKYRNNVPKKVNKRFAGKVCGINKNPNKYGEIRVNGELFKAHLIAWYITNKYWPVALDHINRIKSDNKASNLREGLQDINAKNTSLPKTNTSGHIGVSFGKNVNKWHAYIGIGKRKRLSLGYFTNIEDAIRVRNEAQIKLNYSLNHGKKKENHGAGL